MKPFNVCNLCINCENVLLKLAHTLKEAKLLCADRDDEMPEFNSFHVFRGRYWKVSIGSDGNGFVQIWGAGEAQS